MTKYLALAAALFVLSACDAVPLDEEPPAPAVTVDDYLGTYSVTETCTLAGTDSFGDPRSGTINDAYSATIVRGSEDGRVTVENLFNSPNEAAGSPARVDGSTITLVGDNVGARDDQSITFSGTGTRDEGGAVSLTYTLDARSTTGGPLDAQTTCEATLTPTG